jgi:hypothetical protein
MSSKHVIAACQKHIGRYGNDCSGFAKAVADDLGVVLTGDANGIVDFIQVAWSPLQDGATARAFASRGFFVIGGVKASRHGHVVVVVDGPLAHNKYPYAFWGSYQALTILGQTVNAGFSRGHGTLNYAFPKDQRDQVFYAATKPISLLLPELKPNEGYLLYR